MKIALNKIDVLTHDLRADRPADVVAELASSLRDDGQIQPIAVRKADGDRWELVAGKTRLQAAELLGWSDIEATEYTGPRSNYVAGFLENLKRRQMSPLEDAHAVGRLHFVDGLSIKEIMELLNHGSSWVQDRLALLNYPEELQQAVHERKLTINAAGMLVQIEDKDHRAWLLHIARVNGASTAQCEAWLLDWRARQMLTNPPGGPEPKPQPPALPTRADTPCFTCANLVPNEDALVVRICIPCHDEIRAITNPLTPPSPGNSPPTPPARLASPTPLRDEK